MGDATFDIYATILNVYSDVNEEDDSDKEKYEKLKEKVVEEFQGKTAQIPQIGKDNSKEDDSDYIMFKGNPFDTNLVSVVYDLLSKKYIEEYMEADGTPNEDYSALKGFLGEWLAYNDPLRLFQHYAKQRTKTGRSRTDDQNCIFICDLGDTSRPESRCQNISYE